MKKVNFGCFNTNAEGWIGVDHALRHIVISRIPLLATILHKLHIINREQYDWHQKGCFKSVRYGNATKRFAFQQGSVDYIYSSHMLQHFYRDEALFFLQECYRILKKGGKLRLCLPSWEDLRVQSSFANSNFAHRRKEQKASHKWIWSSQELKDVLRATGFSALEEHEPQQGDFPDLPDLEHRRGLIIQAQK
jgi:predicted SAM-dependent methyltransferase